MMTGVPGYIPYVFIFDQRYAKFASVAILSLLTNSRHSSKIYCIVVGDAEAEVAALRQRVAIFRTELVIVDQTDPAYSRWQAGYHISPAAYGKLFIPELIAEERVIYLDCDLLVTCDLMPLFQHHCGPYALAGCIDPAGGQSSAIPRDPADSYINTGVMLMDLGALRQMGFSAAAVQAYGVYATQATWVDQCIFNKVLERKKAVLPAQWNLMLHEVPKRQVKQQWEPLLGRGIFHFSGDVKPWMRWSAPWLMELWATYARSALPEQDWAVQEPETVQHLYYWVEALEGDGRLEQAYQVRGRLVDLLGVLNDPVRGFAASSVSRRQQLTAQLAAWAQNRVLRGPFEGMILPEQSSGGDGNRASKLLGTYEADLFPALQDFVARAPERVINVGCAEGYYAVGLARLLPGAEVIALDRDPKAQSLCTATAAANGVAVRVAGGCTPQGLANLLADAMRVLVVMDCEGAEAVLLDPVAVPRLAHADIVVETHDFLQRGLKEALAARFATTHEVTVIRQGARDPHAIDALAGLSEAERWLLVDEVRPETMYWLVCRALQPRLT
jgi:lipopolysaccharide biosynthesis glycosyltransferase